MNTPLIVTPGDPAGIGPDVLLQAIQQCSDLPIVVAADKILLQQRAAQLGVPLTKLSILPVELSAPVTAGSPNPVNSNYILKTLEIAVAGCLSGKFRGMVTGPVNKAVINAAHCAFTGHTEFLAKLTNTNPVMLLLTVHLKVALLTTHLPLRAVADAITYEKIIQTIQTIKADFARYFRIPNAKILVCGLNPHAGENGYLGTEEQTVITPALNELRTLGYDITGPVAADTAFTPAVLKHHDVVLTMYHDQGLPVLKHAGFGEAVNMTLGLPFLRTSVDHGTAYSLAGSGQSRPDSLLAAIKLADQLTCSAKDHAP